MGEFSLTHWLIFFAIVLLFFGPSKLPGLGSSLGKAIRGFKSGLNEINPEEPTTTTITRTEQIETPKATVNAQKTETKVHEHQPEA